MEMLESHANLSSEASLSLRISLENLLRNEDGRSVRAADTKALASWMPWRRRQRDFMPARVLLQDLRAYRRW